MSEPLHKRDIDNAPVYFSAYLVNLVRGMLRKHRPALDKELSPLHAAMRLRRNPMQRWCRFFNHGEQSNPPPLTYYIPTSSQAIVQYVRQLHVGYTKLLFAASHIEFSPAVHLLQADTDISLGYSYIGAEAINNTAAIAGFETDVIDARNQMLWRQTDYFYIRHSSASGTLNPHHMRAVKHMRKRSQQLDMASHLIGDFYVWQKMGVDFGLLSGDLNIVHIFDTTAAIFAGGKAFIQGLCTLNIVISMLWKKYGAALSSLNVHYARPVYRGQHIFLLCHAEQVEVVSAHGQLLAFGTFTLRDPEQPQPGGH